jgi:hypothetical protein
VRNFALACLTGRAISCLQRFRGSAACWDCTHNDESVPINFYNGKID